MGRDLIIFGTGVHARKVYHYARQLGFTVVAFGDENPARRSPVQGIDVLPPAAVLGRIQSCASFVAIGNPDVRRRLMELVGKHGGSVVTLVHPTAYVAEDARIEGGTLVAAGAIVETGVTVGAGSIIDIGVVIDHDCTIPPFSHLKPGTVHQQVTS